MADSLEELAFELSLESLAKQEKVLEDIRARAGTLFAASSVVTSFVGGRAVDAAGFDGFTVLALSAFVFAFLPPLYLLSGSGTVWFAIDGARLYSHVASAETSLADVYVALAADIQEVRRENQALVDRTLRSLRFGFGALIAEVVLFLTALAVH